MADVTRYTVTIKGERLMMHNEQLANPFNEYAVELRKFTKKRGKSEEDYREIARIEYQGGLYFDEKIGPFVPAHCLNKMMVQGARKRKLGKLFEEMVLVEGPAPVQYKGPRDRKRLWESGEFVDQRLAGVNAARTLRTRPLFRDWTVQFSVRVEGGAVDREQLRQAVEAAQFIGLLDGRPMYAGQFTLVGVKEA